MEFVYKIASKVPDLHDVWFELQLFDVDSDIGNGIGVLAQIQMMENGSLPALCLSNQSNLYFQLRSPTH